MSTGWDLDSGKGGQGSSTGIDYTKFPEGITRLRFVDDAPHMRWVHWMPKFQRSVNCPGMGCPICEVRRTEKANKMPYSQNIAKRFTMHVINRETGKLEIAEQGKTFYEDVKLIKEDLEAEGKKLIEADLKIRRTGTSKDDTRYRVDVQEKSPLSDADRKLLEGKVDFNEYFKPQTPEQILELMKVTDNFKEEWNRILGYNKEDEAGEEEIEIR